MKCTAHKTNGEPCNAMAVDGYSVCRVHGAHAGRKPVTGFYSKRVRGPLAEKLREAGEIANPLDVTEELLVDKAILAQFLDQFVEGQTISAEMARQLQTMTGEIVRKACAMIRARNDTALTAAEITLVLAALREVVGEFIPPERTPAFWRRLRKRLPMPEPIEQEEDE